MAEQAHARFYQGLPPVVRHSRRRRLIAGGVLAVAVAVIAIPAIALTYVFHSPSASFYGRGYGTDPRDVGLVPPFDRYSLMWIGVAFLVGGVLGMTLAEGWWSMLAVDAVGLALASVLVLGWVISFETEIFGWFLWVLGVSAGVGVRGLMHRRRVLRASFVSQPS